MLVDALLRADHHLKFTQKVFEPEQFLHLTDAVMSFIEASTDPVTNPSLRSSFLFDSLLFTRNLQKLVLYLIESTPAIFINVSISIFKKIDWPMRSLFQTHITAARTWKLAEHYL